MKEESIFFVFGLFPDFLIKAAFPVTKALGMEPQDMPLHSLVSRHAQWPKARGFTTAVLL